MAGKGVEYVLSIVDKMSAPLKNIGNATKILDQTTGKIGNHFNAMQRNASNSLNGVGRGVSQLRIQLDTLTQQRDISMNWNDIKELNRQIQLTEQQLDKLTNSGRKNKLSLDGTPLAQLRDTLTNPVALGVGAAVGIGAGLASATSMAMEFEKSMAKVNATTQLAPLELEKLKKELIEVGRESGGNLMKVPDAYEKINSQVNDAGLSMEILKTSLKGAKAGFTDVDIVSGALAQTLSLVGKENYNAGKVMDILFAGKRVGAGEFEDFARYLPPLVASGQAVNMTLEQTAGLFSFLTGKGLTTEKSATALENAFTALSKSDVTDKMKKLGIEVFDAGGKMKQPLDIFTQFNKKLKGLTDQQKTSFLEKAGLTDAQARQAFVVLTSDLDKLGEALDATQNPLGEMDNALKYTKNTAQLWQDAIAKGQAVMLKLGDVLLPYVVPALDMLNSGLDTTDKILSSVIAFGREYADVIGLVGTMLGAAGLAWGVMNAHLLFTSIIMPVVNTATALFSAILAANPIGLVVMGIAALVAGLIYAYKHFEGFRNAVDWVWESLKAFFIGASNLVKDFLRMLGLLEEEKQVNVEMTATKRVEQTTGNKMLPEIMQNKPATGMGDFLPANVSGGELAVDNTPKGVSKSPVVADPNVLKLLGEGKDKKDKKEKNKNFKNDSGISGVASGGAKTVNINTTIDKLVEQIIINASNATEGIDDMEKQVQEAFLRILNSANSMANQK